MTSRRCILLEEGVRELLELDHYTVRILPAIYNRHSLPVHLVASRGTGETRYIRIRKSYRRRRTIQNVETMCRTDIVIYRRILSWPGTGAGLHCEIWIYSPYDGYHCFEVLPGSVREIPQLVPEHAEAHYDKEAAG
ncbi:MAG: hypothetical protein M0Q91_18325 [Methanoregula sp.]|nr:hypothetical protein [Methanoregula sp.]